MTCRRNGTSLKALLLTVEGAKGSSTWAEKGLGLSILRGVVGSALRSREALLMAFSSPDGVASREGDNNIDKRACECLLPDMGGEPAFIKGASAAATRASRAMRSAEEEAADLVEQKEDEDRPRPDMLLEIPPALKLLRCLPCCE